ncbi:hypothetical protein [Acidimangrovimonas pyrenivorans]|uniref:Uncharacterized protein n=1 Tax=Acidimangrovimonas pyrenivorans TaxID=2030798 RepID=A0ABV7AKR7_9RHOB
MLKKLIRGFVRIQVLIAELFVLAIVLGSLEAENPNLSLLAALPVLALSFFTLVTGKGFPHFRHRGKALLVMGVAAFFSLSGAVTSNAQHEAKLAELKKSDPAAYLTELKRTDDARWLSALSEMDPAEYRKVLDRRQAEADAKRLAKCTPDKLGEAYVMIQADVRRRLRAPSTANFPWQYDNGSRPGSDCTYSIVGHFDAQNGFGAMLRGHFSGKIKYYPSDESWRTMSLNVEG